jgi:hypothetical protein
MPPASTKAIHTAKEKLLGALAELHYFGGKTTFDIKDAAKSAGYNCITGKAIRAAIQELKADGVFTRHKDEITLTDQGIAKLPQVDASSLPTDEEKQAQMMEALLKDDPECKPITNPEKTQAVFDLLLDGKAHTKLELVEVAEYKRLDTKQIRNLFKRMTKLGLLVTVQSGSVRFTDSVWPLRGRPIQDAEDGGEEEKDENESKPAAAPKGTGKKRSGHKRKTLTGEEE